jgi:hypothetical protein
MIPEPGELEMKPHPFGRVGYIFDDFPFPYEGLMGWRAEAALSSQRQSEGTSSTAPIRRQQKPIVPDQGKAQH